MAYCRRHEKTNQRNLGECMKNTFVWGFHGSNLKIIDLLEKEGLIDVKCHLSSDKLLKHSNQFFLKDFTFLNQWSEKYEEKIRLYTKNVKFNQDLYNSLINDFYIYLERESRYENHGIKPVHYYINKFNLLYRFFYSVLVKENIELCLFSNLPHNGVDTIVYKLAKALNIKTFMFCQSFMPNRYDKIFYLENLEDYGDFNFMDKVYDTEKYEIKPNIVPFYMNKKKKKLKLKFKEWRHNLPFYKKYEAMHEYKKTINDLMKPVDYSKKYVYFPLHLQPELTTSTLGGIYCDQMLALERLSEIIPNDWIIYVKENPKQTECRRDKLFFERFKFLDNVQLVPMEENSLELIRHSQFISTITGTAGWEALVENIPVLVFGKAWYKNFEGVFEYNKDLNIQSIIGYKIDRNKLKNDYNNLLSRMPKGVIDSAYTKALPNYNEEESVKNIAGLIKRLINEK